MEQRFKRAINGEDEEKFRYSDCIEACSIGVANSDILIPAFKRTVEQKRKVAQVLEFLKDFQISEKDVIDLQIYIKKQRGLGDISAVCCFQIFDYQGERFCYLFNLKVAVTGQGVGSRLLANIITAVEYDILNWEYNSVFPEKQAPPQIVHYLASVGPKMPADDFYIKQGFILQDDDVEQWAHQDGLKLYHLERQPNFMSHRSVFDFQYKAATLINKKQTNEEEKQEGSNQIQMPEQFQNTPMIEIMGGKSDIQGVSQANTKAYKAKHCRECKKVIGYTNWCKHVKTCHAGVALDFDLCAGNDCLLCNDAHTKTSSNKNRQYICQACPDAKPVRKDSPQGKGGKCYQCSSPFVVSQSKSVVGLRKSGSLIKASGNLSQLGKRPAPTILDMLQFDIQDNRKYVEDTTQLMSDSDQSARLDGTRKVDEYLAKQDLFHLSPMPKQPQIQQQSKDIASLSMSFQVGLKPLSTSLQVVDRLQAIERSVGTAFASVTAAQSIQLLCSSFLDELVYGYIEQAVPHTMLREAVREVQQRTLHLNTQQAAGILFASFLLGGDCLPGAIKSMLILRRSDSFGDIFSALMPAIKIKYGEVLGGWIELHWEFMTSTHLNVMSTMRQTLTVSDVNLLTLLICVTVSSIEEQQVLVQFLSDINGEQQYERILKAIEQNPRQAGLTQQQFFELVVILQNNQFYSTIDHLGGELLQINLCEWVTTIKDTHQQLALINASSAQQFIGELREQMGEINPTLVDDLRQRDTMIRIMFDSIHNPPNERQFAVAQYSLGTSYTQQRQMWVVPSGQGKSRIIATLAYLALKSGMYNKVVLIFSNEDLMKRDQADFADMWAYFKGAAVLYQVGLPKLQGQEEEYTPVVYKGALVIVDEADSIMYDNPSMFHTFIQGNCCIAFTATPEDGDPKSVEASILKHMSFKRFEYIVAKDKADVQINSVSASDKVQYVIEQLSIGPVLLLCGESLASMIKTAAGEQNFVDVRPGVDQQVLRKLDQKIGQLYRVAVCMNEFGIRGIDYRSPNAKLTLVIARSFMHQRDYLQAVKRVGRFNDLSTIVRFDDVPLIDTVSSNQYKAKLFQSCAMLLGKVGTVQLKTAKINKLPVAAGKVTVPSLVQKIGTDGLYKFDQSRLQRLLAQPSKAIGQQTTLNFSKPSASSLPSWDLNIDLQVGRVPTYFKAFQELVNIYHNPLQFKCPSKLRHLGFSTPIGMPLRICHLQLLFIMEKLKKVITDKAATAIAKYLRTSGLVKGFEQRGPLKIPLSNNQGDFHSDNFDKKRGFNDEEWIQFASDVTEALRKIQEKVDKIKENFKKKELTAEPKPIAQIVSQRITDLFANNAQDHNRCDENVTIYVRNIMEGLPEDVNAEEILAQNIREQLQEDAPGGEVAEQFNVALLHILNQDPEFQHTRIECIAFIQGLQQVLD